jgi:hypothetical protein
MQKAGSSPLERFGMTLFSGGKVRFADDDSPYAHNQEQLGFAATHNKRQSF